MDSQEAQISHEVSDDLLKVKLAGPTALQMVTVYATQHQDLWKKRERVLWDLTEIDPSAITSDDILNLRFAFDEIVQLRGRGRTAVVVRKDMELIANVAIGLCESSQAPVEYRAFLRLQDALDWISA